MTSGASIDPHGQPASEEEVAKGLGFINVEAFRRWRRWREQPRQDQESERALRELSNLIERVAALEERIKAPEAATARIGGDSMDQVFGA